MATLVFKVQADYEKVIRLREEIEKLKSSLKGIDPKSAEFSRMNRQLEQTTRQYKNLTKAAAEGGAEIERHALSISKAMTAIGGLAAIKGLISQMIEVRGQFQAADTAIQTLLGSKEKADELLSKVREYAKISPLEFGDITRATQMMLGFNIEANKVPGFIKAIGDVSMGESGKFNSLTLAFSQMSAAGKLMGQDLNQMINAGFNPLSVMAEKTGKSIAELKEEMSKGAITAEMVQQAFMDATSEGGKFFNMSENAAKTINGQISMLHDAIDSAFNEMGTASEGFIVKSISGLTKLAENYETVAKVIGALVATYGVYRTATILAIVAQEGWTAAVKKDTIAKGLNVAATRAMTAGQAALNAVLEANPYVLALTAIMALTAGMWAFSSSTKTSVELSQEFGDTATKATSKLNSLVSILENANSNSRTYAKTIDELKKLYDEYGVKIKTTTDANGKEIASVEELIKKHDELREAIRAESIERQKANAIQTVHDEYNSTVEGMWNDLKDTIGGDNAGTITTSLRVLIPDSDLLKLDELRQKYKALSSPEDKEERNKVHHEFMNQLNETVSKVDKVTERFELSKTKQGSVRRSVMDMIGTIGDANRTLQEGIQVINDAANSTDGYSEKARKAAEHNRINKLSVTELVNEIQNLINNYHNTNLYIHINYDEVNVPSWMKGMGTDKLTQLAKSFTEAAKGGRRVKGYTKEETLERAAQYAKAAAASQADDDKKKNQPAPSSGGTKRTGSRDDGASRRARLEEEERRWSEKMQKEQREAGFAERQAHIDGLEKGFEKEREQLELEYDKQKAQIKEQEEQYRKEAYEHAKKEWDADSKNKHKAFSDNHNIADFAPTEEQQRIIDASLRSAAEKHRKAVEEINRDELNAYYEFLNEYGTLQQQRYAVTAEYDERIAKEKKDVNRRKMLEKEKASKLSSLNAQSLAMNIDWGQTFSGLGNVLSSVAEATLKKVNDYMKTDEYRKLGGQDKQVYQELRAQLMSASGNNMSNPFAASTWNNIGNLAKQYEASVEFLIKAQEKEKKAREDLEKAVDDEAKARAKAAFEEASEEVKQAEGAVIQNQQAVEDATKKAADGLNFFNETLSNITSGSLKGFADGVIKLIGAITGDDGLAKGLEGMGKTGTIVGAILSILDALGTKPVEFIEELFNKLAETLQEVIKNLPQILLSAVKGVGSMIGGIFSGIGSWFGLTSSGNVAEVNEITEKNTKTIERLNKSIDKLKDAIDKSNGARAVTSYEEAYSAQQRIIQQQLEILRAQMAYTSNHHSNAKNWGKEFDRSNYAQINALLGTNINSLEGIYGLSPEQMDKIRTHLTDVWKDMLDVGKYDKSEYWENYADLAGKLEELTEQINENLTQTSFDSMRDNFVSALMDMNTSASDFTKNFSEMMMQSLLNMSIGNILDDELKGWYDKWAERLKAGELSPYEIAQYRKEWDSMVARGMEERDRLAQLTGYDVMYQDQSATSRGIQNITQDQADQLIGRVTAVQIAVEQGNAKKESLASQLTLANATASEILSLSSRKYDIVADTQRILSETYIEVKQINEHTESIDRNIKDMKSDIQEIKKTVKEY